MAERTVLNIGQQIKTVKDETVEKAFGSKEVIKKGTTFYVGADGFIHYRNGNIRKLGDNFEVKGYSAKGLAEYMYSVLSNRFQINEMLEDYEWKIGDFKEEIEMALEELGFYDDTGNIS